MTWIVNTALLFFVSSDVMRSCFQCVSVVQIIMGVMLLDSATRRWLWLMPCMVEQDTPIVGVVFPMSSHELLISTWIPTLVELTARSQAWRSRWLSFNEEALEPAECTQHPNPPQHGGWFLSLITIKISLTPEADPKSGLFTLSTSLTWIWDQPRKRPMKCCWGNALVIGLIISWVWMILNEN